MAAKPTAIMNKTMSVINNKRVQSTHRRNPTLIIKDKTYESLGVSEGGEDLHPIMQPVHNMREFTHSAISKMH